MKPRQTLKNYHIPNLTSPFQNSSTSQASTSRDVDLSKLALNLNEMPNLQANPNLSNPEDLVECLQAIYGKNSTEILQKLPQLNDWPMRSTSPPDYSRLANNSSVPGGSSSGLGSQSNRVNFNNTSTNTNNINNNNNNNIISNNNSSGQQKQDTPYNASQHQSQASAINHFRVSASNMHSQQKSVLSLHQHHQNDMSNRRLNQHISTTNASFANLNSINASNATSTSSLSLDASNSGILGGSNIVNKNSGISGASTHVSNIMDTISSIDNMFNDGSLQANKDNSNYQQSMMRHQQLQKLLQKAHISSQLKALPPSSSSSLPHRNDPQLQRNISSNNMSQAQIPSTSPASMMSPPQPAFTSVPKSLLNLAACSSSSSSSGSPNLRSATSKFSSMVSQLNFRSARNHNTNNNGNQSGVSAGVNSNRTTAKTNNVNTNSSSNNDAFNQRTISSNDNNTNVLQHQNTRSGLANTASNLGQTSRTNLSKQLQMSLLSEDQTSNNRTNYRNASNAGPSVSSRGQTVSQRLNVGQTSKEAYLTLADLQERAARVGVSIGEINKAVQPNNLTGINNATNLGQQGSPLVLPNQQSEESVNTVDRKEIESAISRVEARNDLSLLYPPVLLATSSQKHINALSAGLQGTEDSELFTKEVRKIVLEECNIIYECKECNNLFRSLANLIKHKRTYCIEHNADKSTIDISKYSQVVPPGLSEGPTINNAGILHRDSIVQPDTEVNNESQTENVMQEDPDCNQNQWAQDRRNNIGPDLRTLRNMRNQERKNLQDREVMVTRFRNANNSTNFNTPQTSLSKLLQSQPKNRLPVSRDSALMGALSMKSKYSSNDPPLSNSMSLLENDRNIGCSGDVDEQLIRHSSLAKTLLNEKVKTSAPRQSSIELTRAESDQADVSNKRTAPKRKLLEDCIKKVKRDKLLTEEDGEQANMPTASTSQSGDSKACDVQQGRSISSSRGASFIEHDFNDPNKINSSDDSDIDSDQLMIDLDGAKQRESTKQVKRRPSTAASSTASSSSSVRLNTSSALLKALTRPVDPKKPYTSSQQLCEERPCANQPEKLLVNCHGDTQIKSKEMSSNTSVAEEEEEIASGTSEILNSLFDKYTCDACGIDFETSSLLTEHTNERHSDGSRLIYPCLFCSFSFVTLENVCKHVIEIHKKSKEQMPRLKEISRYRAHQSLDYTACVDSEYSNHSQSQGELEAADDGLSIKRETDTCLESEIVNNEDSSHDAAVSEENKTTNTSPAETRRSQSVKTENDPSTCSDDSDSEISVDIQDPDSDDASQPDEPEVDSPIAVQDQNDQAQQRSPSLTKSSEKEHMPSTCSDDSDSSDISVVSPDPDQDSDVSQTNMPDDEQTPEAIPDAKQAAQKSSNSNKPTSDATASTSSGGGSGGGGIMKLKIQLKTRPDEKSKVYEIV